MPVDPSASLIVTAFRYVPEFAQGLVRDLRVRWALEETGRVYRTELLDAFHPRPDSYLGWQPFGQVPAIDDNGLRVFESGAILLYLGEQNERLLPRDPQGRWQATEWLIAALNSVEPMIMQLGMIDVFKAEEPWTREARPGVVEFLRTRLAPVDAALSEKDWLAGRFSVADIMMVTVLRGLRHTQIVAEFPRLAAYVARAEDRPAFRQALADQLADFHSAQGEDA